MTTITISRATVEQALEALEDWDSPMALPAVVALRAALAQQAYTDDLNQRIKLYVGSRCAPPQPAEPQTTHSSECWRWHHKCAIAEVERLRAALEQQAWVCPESPEHRYAKPGHCEDCGRTLVRAQQAERFCDTHCTWADHAAGCVRAEPVQEPVAWIQPDHLQKARVAPFLCRVEPTKRCADFVPLYLAPPQRKPLTQEEIGRVWPDNGAGAWDRRQR